jgi:hypothetical protein
MVLFYNIAPWWQKLVDKIAVHFPLVVTYNHYNMFIVQATGNRAIKIYDAIYTVMDKPE